MPATATAATTTAAPVVLAWDFTVTDAFLTTTPGSYLAAEVYDAATGAYLGGLSYLVQAVPGRAAQTMWLMCGSAETPFADVVLTNDQHGSRADGVYLDAAVERLLAGLGRSGAYHDVAVIRGEAADNL